jgi:hypothetical protein
MQSEFVKYLIEVIKKQGISFIILSCIVYYFYVEMQELKAEFNACNQNLMQLYSSHSTQMQEVIIRNTQAFEKIEAIIEKNK